MHNIINISLQDFIKNNYSDYGKFVNIHRVIQGSDGLKKVYRRALLGAKEVANGKLTPTTNVLGATQVLHPFGEKSSLDVISTLARLNFLTGDGAFGKKSFPEDLQAAAPRYTMCGLSKEQSDFFFRLSKYSPEIEGETTMEPEYLINPVPICLIHGSLNWGLGICSRTPAFTYESLVESYYNNDPSLLESSFGYKINHNDSDLKSLWETGVGRLSLSSKVIRSSEDKVLMITSGEIFKPQLGLFSKGIKDGQLVIGNESSKEIGITVSRISRARNVDMDQVYKSALQASTMSRSYNILVVENECIRTIGIKEWMTLTMGRYTKYFNQSKNDRIAECEAKIKVLEVMPTVAKLIIDQKSDSDILKSVTGLSQETLDSIKRKSIGSLRKTDYQPELDSLAKQIISINKEDAKETIKGFSKSMFGL